MNTGLQILKLLGVEFPKNPTPNDISSALKMNNPLGFISASLQQPKPTFADIVEHLELYQTSIPNPDQQILDHAEEIDLNYILEDLPKVIHTMMIACDRLKNISTSTARRK